MYVCMFMYVYVLYICLTLYTCTIFTFKEDFSAFKTLSVFMYVCMYEELFAFKTLSVYVCMYVLYYSRKLCGKL